MNPGRLRPAAALVGPLSALTDLFPRQERDLGDNVATGELIPLSSLRSIASRLPRPSATSDDVVGFLYKNLTLPASASFISCLIQVKTFNSGIVCVVCQDPIRPSELPHAVSGRHLFHRPCIEEWLKRSNRCPSCRYPCPTDNLLYEEYRKRSLASPAPSSATATAFSPEDSRNVRLATPLVPSASPSASLFVDEIDDATLGLALFNSIPHVAAAEGPVVRFNADEDE